MRSPPFAFVVAWAEPLVGFLVCVVLPGLIFTSTPPFVTEFGARERTLVATGMAYLVVWYCGRRVDSFPGGSIVDYVSYIAPIISVAYGTFAFVLLGLRLDYSRIQFFGSGFLILLWSPAAVGIRKKLFVLNYAVVPASLLDAMPNVPTCRWLGLEGAFGRSSRVDAIVTDLGTQLSERELFDVTRAAIAGVPVLDRRFVVESLTGRTPLQGLAPNEFGGLLPSHQYLFLRRIIELVATLALIPVLLPAMLAIAVAIRLDSKGPIIFAQARGGQYGRVFNIYKFRSMHVGSGGPDFTSKDDLRVTRVGAFLRRFHLDETPQFLNILLGQMSWVGPRPETLALAHHYAQSIPYFEIRGIVRPGITGWAQINQGYARTLEEMRVKLEYDLYYLKHCSAWLDLMIVLRTVVIVFGGRRTR